MNKKVFAFDLGKTSIGYCVRENLDIKELGSVIVDKDHAEVISNRDRRRTKRTLNAHKKREEFFEKIWKSENLEILDKDDLRFKREFSSKNDDTIYNSALLRIALLQGKRLEKWQIYKALHAAIQRRGYDNVPWARALTEDEKNNEVSSQKYTKENDVELIKNEKYKYPCYYDALRLGLWQENLPDEFKHHIPLTGVKKVRDMGLVAPRYMVENELRLLFQNAQKQIKELEKYSVEYFLYGDYEQAYASYNNQKFQKFRGTERDWQGVLGQKIPRFDNRIIMKCKLLPKRNVCSANCIENATFVILMKLKNLRFTDDFGEKCQLDYSAIRDIYSLWLEKVYKNPKSPNFAATVSQRNEIEKVMGFKIKEKIEPLKANISGRSSFCRRACKIMNKIILEGIENPQTMDFSEFIDDKNSPNGIGEDEIKTMLSKIGKWDNLYVSDNRYEMAEKASDNREKTDILIGNITNPIVRNRLQIFRDKLLMMKEKYGEPDEVIFELVRDGADNSLFGAKKAKDFLKKNKENEKNNLILIEKLKAADKLSGANFEKIKLLEMQNGVCIYSGKKIGINDFDKCEIDHIFPRSKGGNDASYNKVLCYAMENQLKRERNPYEWLHNDEQRWQEYITRLSDDNLVKKLGKQKFELLTNNLETCEKIIESRNAIAETAQIARVAQDIAAFVFGWGLQTKGDNRRIFVNNGLSTSQIRKRYGLNKILGDDAKKNRENDKHHALDAICISFSRDFKYDPQSKKDTIKGFTYDIAKEAIDKLVPYPYANDKPLKINLKPKETYYGKRVNNGGICLTERTKIEEIKQDKKNVEKILDEYIKTDLLNKLEEKLNSTEWVSMLKNYIHPKKQTLVKKVRTKIDCNAELTTDLNGRQRMGVYVDFGTKGVKGQFKCSKGHKGQILYYDTKGAIKVMPIFANIKTQEVLDKLKNSNCELYKNGMMFYSGCLVEISEEFNGTVYYKNKTENGEDETTHKNETIQGGIFKLRTIISSGVVKLENSCGQEILTNVKNLTNANFKKYPVG